jgi:tetratricopeptide (TPR) repeat protein
MRFLLALSLLLSATLAVADPAPSGETAKINDLIARNQLEPAHAAALAWAEAHPEDAQAAFWVGATAGQLAMRSGMFKAMGYAKTSRQAFESAVELDPTDVRAQFSLMQFYLMAPGMMGGDTDEAKAIAERLAKQSTVDGLRAQGQILAVEKDMDGWLRENKAALALQPAHPEALGNAVGYLLGKNDFVAAKALIDAAKAVDPEHVVIRYQYVKWAALSGQELEPALSVADALIAMPVYPDRFSLAGAHFRRAQLLARLERKADAIAAYEACLAIDPEMKGVEEALEELQEA